MNLAACRSALLRSKVVMRIGCCLVAASVLMSCFAMPKAKAVVTEGALLGSLFGSLLVSMGYSWAADNFDAPTFGEAIYDLIKDCDEEMDTGIQLLLDSQLAGVTAVGNGKLTFSQQWVKLANSFAVWFNEKFLQSVEVGENVPIVSGNSTVADADGNIYEVQLADDYGVNSYNINYSGVTNPGTIVFSYGESSVDFDFGGNAMYTYGFKAERDALYCKNSSGSYTLYSYSWGSPYTKIAFIYKDGYLYFTQYRPDTNSWQASISSNNFAVARDITLGKGCSLTAEKPQEVHYPDVAEDGSQVYEITVDGVTATDIDGIIQGAVDQILAGTAAIAGEVAQAQDVPADPEVPPELDGLDLPALGAALTSRFPFSIPWDVARGIGLLAAPAEAPYWEVDFLAPIGYRVGGWKGDTTIILDMSDYEIIGQVTRWMSTIGFCLMLAASTKRLVWVA